MASRKPSLRDQFIMAALSALSAGSWNGTACDFAAENQYDVPHNMAQGAINIADEILRLTGRDADGNPLKGGK